MLKQAQDINEESPIRTEISSIDQSRHKLSLHLQEKIDTLETLHDDLLEIEVTMDTCQQQLDSINFNLNKSIASLDDIKDLNTTLQVSI